MNAFKAECFACIILVVQICVNGQAITVSDASAAAQSYASSSSGVGLAGGQFVIPAVIRPILQSEPCYEQSVAYAPPFTPGYGCGYPPPPPMYPPMILGRNNNNNDDDFDDLLYLILFASLGRGGCGGNGGGYGGNCGGGCNNGCGGCNGGCGGYGNGCGCSNSCNGCGNNNYGGNCGGCNSGCNSNSYTTCSVPFSLSGSTVDSCSGDVYTFVPSTSTTSGTTTTGTSSNCPPSIQIVLTDNSGNTGSNNPGS